MGFWSDYDEIYNAPRQEAVDQCIRQRQEDEAEAARKNGEPKEIENENKS